MELKFWIGNTEIEEPIGFDKFKATIERTENHGVSAEVSVGSLEFYGIAYSIVKNAYNNDIDIELVFRVEMACDDKSFLEIYKGVIDLSTYEEQTGDYCLAKCKVGEIGRRTTFNNRSDTKVDLASETNLDNTELLPDYLGIDIPIVISSKAIRWTTKAELKKDSSLGGFYNSLAATSTGRYCAGFGDNYMDEIGNYYPIDGIIRQLSGDDMDIRPFMKISNRAGQKVNIKGEIKLRFTLSEEFADIAGNYDFSNGDYTIGFYILKKWDYLHDIPNGSIVHNGHKFMIKPTLNMPQDYNIPFELEYTLGGDDVFFLCLELKKPGYFKSGNLLLLSGSYIHITLDDVQPDTTVKVTLIHEAFSRISEIISGLKVKSNWYGRDDSLKQIGLIQNNSIYECGGGALKCITNGLKLRQATLTNGDEPKLFLSFKDLFLAMKAVDNVGWGFSEENGETCIRVEPWQWFYKNNIILDIKGVNKKSRKIMPSNIYSKIKIGYSKYYGLEEINAIDTFHTERVFSNTTTTVNNKMEQLCKFIADPYAIEFTRRKALDKNTKDWRFDNDVFLIELIGYMRPTMTGYSTTLEVATGMIDTDDSVISPDTMLNCSITPFRNALRWIGNLVCPNNRKSFSFTSGTGNFSAKGKPKPKPSDVRALEDSGDVVSEKGELSYIKPLLKAELVTFDYPITIEEYNHIKENPYGIIRVDDEEFYIKKIEYSYLESLAKFELIPKNK